ncbi:MAG: amino acid ABC transporter substrate-binding protein [Halioglobus sp.]|nr:amino acid ABC transporter substrate-binding protein [Halioglobus sp.]
MMVQTKVIRIFLASCLLFALTASGFAQTLEPTVEPSPVEPVPIYGPIKIGTTQSLTGHYSDQGVEQLRGLQMWAADVNTRGALLGRTVDIVYYDDRSRDAGTVEGFNRLLKEDKVDLLVGPYSSSLTLKATLVAEQFNVPIVTTAASSEEIWSRGLKNVFGVDTPARDYVQGIHLTQNTGAYSVALVYATTEFAEEVAAAVREELGDRLFFVEGYAPEERNFEGLAGRLYEMDADLILGISYLEDSIALTRAIKQKAVKPRMLAYTIGPGLYEFGEELGADAEGIMGIVQWLRSSREPGAQDFAYRYKQRYGYIPGVYAVIGYSAGQVLEAAVRLAGTTDHASVNKQLRSMFIQTLIGTYNVDDTGRQIGRRNIVLQWQNHQRRLVSPEYMAETALIYPLP